MARKIADTPDINKVKTDAVSANAVPALSSQVALLCDIVKGLIIEIERLKRGK